MNISSGQQLTQILYLNRPTINLFLKILNEWELRKETDVRKNSQNVNKSSPARAQISAAFAKKKEIIFWISFFLDF